MPIWKAIVLGLIQGLAEFLPISSSGHLVIFKEIMKIDLEGGGMFFDVMLHLGTLIAIFVVFWRDISKMIIEGLHIIGDFFYNLAMFFQRLAGKDVKFRRMIRSSYRKFVMLVIVSTIPTGIIGILIKDTVQACEAIILVPGICLLVTAVFLAIADAVDPGTKRPKEITYKEAGFIGIAQGIATLPGLSRSGTTITACLLCGFEKKFAVKYSFIMSIPAVLGAVVLEIKDFNANTIAKSDILPCIVGTCVSMVVGYLAICYMMRLIQNRNYRGFVIYCALVGAIVIGYGLLA